MAQEVARQRLGVRRDVERLVGGDTPAYGQAVMLRTELPQASRVVRPASARRRIAGSTSCSFDEVQLDVLPRRDVAEAARVALGDVGERVRAVARSRTPCGIFTRSIWASSACRWP